MTAPVLPVPWISQLTNGALAYHNDCGAAAGLMIARAYKPSITTTVDEFYRMTGATGDRYLSAGEIAAVLARYGITTTWRTGQSLGALFETLTGRKPSIALINYGVLVDAGVTERSDFRGSHFVTVVGADIHTVYIHDPYWRTDRGERLQLTPELFVSAWTRTNEQSNPTRGVLTPDAGIGEQVAHLYRARIIETMRVRSGPGQNYDTVDRLTPGAVVAVVEDVDGWGRFAPNRWLYTANANWVQRLP
jgi:hypothetical protein